MEWKQYDYCLEGNVSILAWRIYCHFLKMHYYLLQTVMSKSGKFLKELLLHWKLLHYLRNHKGADRGGKVGTFLCEMYTQIQGNETCTL